jgi:hypothetical protein
LLFELGLLYTAFSTYGLLILQKTWQNTSSTYSGAPTCNAFRVAAWVAWPISAWLVIASLLLDPLLLLQFYLLSQTALTHAFWEAAWVAWPLAAWLVIASQLLGHESYESVPGRL